MAWPEFVHFDIDDLPGWFSYKPVTPVKRMSSVQTVGDVVIREAPEIVPGDILIPWELPNVCKVWWDYFRTKYDNIPTEVYDFVGYWGDELTVIIWTLDQPTVRGRLWDLSGSFRVATITAYADPLSES